MRIHGERRPGAPRGGRPAPPPEHPGLPPQRGAGHAPRAAPGPRVEGPPRPRDPRLPGRRRGGATAAVRALVRRWEAPPEPLLRQGSRGPEVAEVQGELNGATPPAAPALVVDSVFGPLTRQAVVGFQAG